MGKPERRREFGYFFNCGLWDNTKCVSKKDVWKLWTGLIWHRIWTGGGFF